LTLAFMAMILTLTPRLCQKDAVRCPGHTIHFLRFDYFSYTGKILRLADIELSRLEVKTYDPWEN